jgi:hypothetical protein
VNTPKRPRHEDPFSDSDDAEADIGMQFVDDTHHITFDELKRRLIRGLEGRTPDSTNTTSHQEYIAGRVLSQGGDENVQHITIQEYDPRSSHSSSSVEFASEARKIDIILHHPTRDLITVLQAGANLKISLKNADLRSKLSHSRPSGAALIELLFEGMWVVNVVKCLRSRYSGRVLHAGQDGFEERDSHGE